MKVELEGKIAIVTGGARGIGFSAARLLSECGATVIVADIDEVAATEAAAQLRGAIPLRLDISQEKEVAVAVETVIERFERVDILVNNAGIGSLKSRVTIDEFPIAEWDHIMAVDLRGPFLVSREVSRRMVKAGGGRIVNIASVLGVVPARLQCPYTTAKAGVVNLTRTMALELAPHGILVNCVAPGSTLTQSTQKLFYGEAALMESRAKRLLEHVPLGRVGRPEEIAQAILFFCAPESSYITGQTLCVDGGWSAGGFLRDF